MKTFPVTDDELDAPDGAMVDGFERVGMEWRRLMHTGNVRELKLTVDENDLLNEWKGQAQMMLDFGTDLADALEERDTAKAALAVVAAKLASDIRANPDTFNCAKVTEATVAEIVLLLPAHTVATQKLITAQHKVKLLEAAVESIGQRKSTLQGMTDLWLKQWYSDSMHHSKGPAELRAAGTPTKTISRRVVRRPRDE